MHYIHRSITLHRVAKAIKANNDIGFCASCGEETHNCHQDARGNICEKCGKHEVFGADAMILLLARQ